MNLQKINLKNKVFKCLSGEISKQLSLRKCKTDLFHKSNLEVGNELSTYDLIHRFISMRTGTHLGVSICAFIKTLSPFNQPKSAILSILLCLTSLINGEPLKVSQ